MFKVTTSYINMQFVTAKAVKKKELRKSNEYSKEMQRTKGGQHAEGRSRTKLISYHEESK